MDIKTLILILLVNILYLLYRSISTKIYRDKLDDLKNELFIEALEKDININSNDYLKSELKIEALIRYADKNVMLDFLFLKHFLTKKDNKKEIDKLFEKIFYIENQKMREIDDKKTKEAFEITTKNLLFGSFCGWIYLLFILTKALLFSFKNKSEIRIRNIIQDKMKSITEERMMTYA